MLRRTITCLTLLALTILVGTGCRSMTGKGFGEQVHDKSTTASVKTKLIAIRGRNLGQVGVDTNHGVVYLSGTVPDQAVADQAVDVASRTSGVRQVVNQLWVRPDGTNEARAPQTSAVASASPKTEPGRTFSAQGEVAAVDRSQNRVTLKSGGGNYDVSLPASAIASIHEGDRVELTVRPIR